MGKMTAIRKIQTHNSPMRIHNGCVHGKVSWRSAVWLNVDTPLGWVQPEQVQGPLLCEQLYLVDILVATIISLTRLTLAILVVEAGPHALQHGQAGEVLAGNHLQSTLLPLLLVHDDVVYLGVGLNQGGVDGPFRVRRSVNRHFD